MLTTNIIYFTNQFISCFMNECWPGILCLFANVAVGFINKFLCFFVRHQNHNLHKCWFSFTDFFLKFYIHNISFFSNFLKKKCIIFSLKSRDFLCKETVLRVHRIKSDENTFYFKFMQFLWNYGTCYDWQTCIFLYLWLAWRFFLTQGDHW